MGHIKLNYEPHSVMKSHLSPPLQTTYTGEFISSLYKTTTTIHRHAFHFRSKPACFVSSSPVGGKLFNIYNNVEKFTICSPHSQSVVKSALNGNKNESNGSKKEGL